MRTDTNQSRKRRLLTISLLALVVLALLLLAPLACGGDDDGGSTGPAGQEGLVSFAYTGGVAGSYSARGVLNTQSTTMPFTTWAAGGRSGNEVVVAALSPRTAPYGDFFVAYMIVTTAAPVQLVVNDACTQAGTCAVDLGFLLDVDVNDLDSSAETSWDWSCMLTNGTVNVGYLGTDRVRGTFSGTASCVDDSPEPDRRTTTISNGTFDVPLNMQPPTSSAASRLLDAGR